MKPSHGHRAPFFLHTRPTARTPACALGRGSHVPPVLGFLSPVPRAVCPPSNICSQVLTQTEGGVPSPREGWCGRPDGCRVRILKVSPGLPAPALCQWHQPSELCQEAEAGARRCEKVPEAPASLAGREGSGGTMRGVQAQPKTPLRDAGKTPASCVLAHLQPLAAHGVSRICLVTRPDPKTPGWEYQHRQAVTNVFPEPRPRRGGGDQSGWLEKTPLSLLGVFSHAQPLSWLLDPGGTHQNAA